MRKIPLLIEPGVVGVLAGAAAAGVIGMLSGALDAGLLIFFLVALGVATIVFVVRYLKRLRQSEAKNDALLSAIPDMIFLFDREGRFVDYRAQSEDVFYQTPDRFLGKTVDEVLPDAVARQIFQAIEDAVRTGRSRQVEYALPMNGSDFIYEARLARISNNRVVGIVRDVTRQREAEQATREAEARFRTLVEHSIVGTYILQDGIFAYVNPRFGEIVGRPAHELIGTPVADLVVEEDWPIVDENIRRRLAGEIDHIHYTVRGRHADGSVITAEVFGSITSIDSRPAIIGTLLDVTERERSRIEIASLKSFYEETLSRLPLEVAVVDRELRYRYLNPLAVRDEALRTWFLGRTLDDYCREYGVNSDTFAARKRWMQDVIRTGESSSFEEEVPAEAGRTRSILRVAAPVKGDNGEVEFVVGYALDVSERKEYEKKLLEAKNRAEEMARLKSTFLANMSHEIRTPLTGILGFASLLEEEVDTEQRHFASLILRSGRRLLETLNAVLDLSRIEAGEMHLEVRPVDLSNELREAVALFRPLAIEKGLDLRLDLPETAVQCRVDPNAMHIILNNLIGNAIKFTVDGGVNVLLGEHSGIVRLSIEDSGIGIDEGFMPHLFEEFKQESVGLTRSHEGAGLGLAITRRLVEMMGGDLQVTSIKGRGSTFSVVLPAATDPPLFTSSNGAAGEGIPISSSSRKQ